MKRRMLLLLALALLLALPALADTADSPETPGSEGGEILLDAGTEPAATETEGALGAPTDTAAPAVKTIKLKSNTVRKTTTVYLGTDYQIKVSGSKIKKCKSTAKSVATVTGAGRILLLKEGRVKIKVTLKNGRTIPLTLVVQDPNAATELGYRVDRSGPLAVGDVIHITAEVKPAAAAATVTFRSSDASVASVDASGTVTALSPGDATITVSAGGMKLTYDVKVTG